jgi:hypothetical protein
MLNGREQTRNSAFQNEHLFTPFPTALGGVKIEVPYGRCINYKVHFVQNIMKNYCER